MSIADQVDTLEQDHAAALAEIGALNADKAALASANASLQRDLVGLQLEVNDMKHYVDDARAMAEQLAESAMGMLRASRRQVGGQAEVIPFAPISKQQEDLLLKGKWERTADGGATLAKINTQQAISDLVDADPRFAPKQLGETTRQYVGRIADHVGVSIDSVLLPQNNEPEPPAQQAVTEIMAGDSGDENDSHFHIDDVGFNAEMQKALEADGEKLRQMTGQDHGPTFVVHDKDDLPIFLQRDTVFQAERQIFA